MRDPPAVSSGKGSASGRGRAAGRTLPVEQNVGAAAEGAKEDSRGVKESQHRSVATSSACSELKKRAVGVEPTICGFAGRRLAAWLRARVCPRGVWAAAVLPFWRCGLPRAGDAGGGSRTLRASLEDSNVGRYITPAGGTGKGGAGVEPASEPFEAARFFIPLS